jgi:NitT/TauT family transport system permease protein
MSDENPKKDPAPPDPDVALAAFEQGEAKKQEVEKEAATRKARRAEPGIFSGFFAIRDDPGALGRLVWGALCLALILAAWFVATRDWWGPNGNERAIDRYTLGSPEEVFGGIDEECRTEFDCDGQPIGSIKVSGGFKALWFDRALMRNLLASLWRVLQGFGLAVLVGVPLGILCGTFRRIDAFFAPISLFGRNVPIAALVPLTMVFFGIEEGQKIAFMFAACVAFVMYDASRAVADIREEYLDTASTLGASRWQSLSKVLIPLAAPDIFNSVRLMFGLAFGYIVLAEMVNAEFGVGKLILNSQRIGPKNDVYLILFFLTIVAFLLDRLLFTAQRFLFPYRYGRR